MPNKKAPIESQKFNRCLFPFTTQWINTEGALKQKHKKSLFFVVRWGFVYLCLYHRINSATATITSTIFHIPLPRAILKNG